MTGNVAATLRHQRSLRRDTLGQSGFGRDAELQAVIAQVEERLAKLRRITRSDPFDEKLAAIEAIAAPYAIALLYEVRRLERLLCERQQRSGHRARRSRARRGMRRGGA